MSMLAIRLKTNWDERMQDFKSMNPGNISLAAARSVAGLISSRFYKLNEERPNKLGGKRTGFWANAGKDVHTQKEGDGARVTLNQVGIAQRFFGGRIEPVRAKMLTIPISPVSYGHTASEFPGSFLLKTKKGAYIVQYGLMDRISKTAQGKAFRKLGGNANSRQRASLNFLFRLQSSVNQKADPTVLPTEAEMNRTAEAAANSFINRLLSKNK